WHQAASQRLPVIGMVNKLDREGYDHTWMLGEIRDRLGIEPLPLFVPVRTGPDGVSIIDVLEGRRLTWSDLDKRRGRIEVEIADLTAEELELRRAALDVIADGVASFDDELAGLLLEEEEPSRALWTRAIKSAVEAQACLPLVAGAARAGAGIEAVMNAVVELLPTPEGARSVPLFDLGSGARLASWPESLDDATVAYVFKTESRAGGRRLAYIRIYSGVLAEGAELVRQPSGDGFAAAGLVEVLGGWEEPVTSLSAGSVGGILMEPGQSGPGAGETLLSPGHALSFEPPRPPRSCDHRQRRGASHRRSSDHAGRSGGDRLPRSIPESLHRSGIGRRAPRWHGRASPGGGRGAPRAAHGSSLPGGRPQASVPHLPLRASGGCRTV
ncbi:MAG: hypothetical protein VX938_10010, partial [Myxococcota bacterium]|nr:hypothetical protein [Myxococcota bacterium]